MPQHRVLLISIIGVLLLARVTTASSCAYNCSEPEQQGSCVDGSCVCVEPYSVPYCRFRNIAATPGAPFSLGDLSAQWRVFFNFNVDANVVRVSCSWEGPASSPPLLLASSGASLPSVSSYDVGNLSSSDASSISLQATDATQSLWTVGVLSSSSSLSSLSCIATVEHECPNSCNSRGSCLPSSGQCSCQGAYQPPDCSYALVELPADGGTDLQRSLAPFSWVYYTISVISASQSQLQIRIDGASTALMLYVNEGSSLPSSLSYRYSWSTSKGPFALPFPQVTPFTLGVLSSSSPVIFNATVSVLSVCPNSCNARGTCDSSSSSNPPVCRCNAGWLPPDCSQFSAPLSGGLAEGRLVAHTPLHYQYQVPSQINYATWNATSPTFLASSASSVSALDYEYALLPGQGLTVPVTPFDVWQIAVAPGQGPFLLQVETSLRCPNDCSGANGECLVSGVCDCKPNFQRADCSLYSAPLESGQVHHGDASVQSPRVYTVDTSNQTYNQLLFTLNTASDSPSTLVLYASFGALPSRFTYDFAGDAGSPTQRIVVGDGPAGVRPGLWYVGVFAAHEEREPFQLTFEGNNVCVNQCSGHGDCDQGTCRCSQSWTMPDCSARDLPINPDQQMSGQARPGVWSFFHISVQTGDALLVQVDERLTKGKVWVYVQFQGYPTQFSFFDSSTSFTQSHSIIVRNNQGQQGVWRIGVIGSPNLGYQNPSAPYSIKVTTGCQTYATCGACVQDPGCGFCHEKAFNETIGRCLAGSHDGSILGDGTCIVWSYSTCEVDRQRQVTIYIGLAIGISLGLLICLGVALAAYLYWKRGMRAASIIGMYEEEED